MLPRSLFNGRHLRVLLHWAQTCGNAGGRSISTELTAALRPFYFAVHPDFFGKHPEQRNVNEDSLKQLNAHMELLHERKYHVLHESKTLQFYIREENAKKRDTFKLIQVKLDRRVRDPKAIIQQLLELCNLPTDYIKSIQSARATTTASRTTPPGSGYDVSSFKPGRDYEYGIEFGEFEFYYEQSKREGRRSLDAWMAENAAIAKARNKELAPLKEEVLKLQKSVVQRLGLLDARYDCGWNFEHYRGCLKSLERLAALHEQHMQTLRGRIVVFAPFTGISLEGHVMLYTGDVLNNWIDFIRNIPKHDAFLKKIPLYENTLSQVLCEIKIGRRKFMPKQQAVQYAGHLRKITTTLGDYLSVNKYPKKWPATLRDYEIVIESESGPLMLNPTGQLIAPATCPAFMLIDFISANLPLAKERIIKYQQQKHIEIELTERCMKQLKLKSLTKDDSVTPDKMIDTLNGLLRYNSALFEQIDLHITTYYSVLTDGIVCIPWDFMSR